MNRTLLLAIIIMIASPLTLMAQRLDKHVDPYQHAFANPTDDSKLPRVLIIGDSISIAYTPLVRTALKGKANVHRPQTNCRWSAIGNEKISEWLGDGKWDVIHFNFGLWDMYGWSQDEKATPESYGKNLDEIVGKLKATNAKLIFAMTTPPCVASERNAKKVVTVETAKKFNQAATAVMKKHGVPINNLFNPIVGRREQFQKNENDVHYNIKGRKLLGARVSARIAKTLDITLAKPDNKKPEGYAKSVPTPTFSEVRYGDHKRHVIDFWKAESDKPTPLAFVIHGGGWVGGSKERVDRFANVQALLDAKISVASINYRLINRNGDGNASPPVKAPLDDAARALQFVRSKAKEWNIDKNRVGAAGGSAGACSSLWLAFHDDLADPSSTDPIARESTRLQCAAVKGAQTTLDPQQMKAWTPNSKYGGHAFGIKGNFDEFLAKRNSITEWITEYSPYAHVSSDDPAVYLIYSAPPGIGKAQKDPTHTSNFGVKLLEHCKEQNVECQLVYPGAKQVKFESATDFLIDTLKR